eukprot:1-Eustigmatos_ZCMA.PRE.8
MRALGRSQDLFSDNAIALKPIFAQFIQNLHTLAPGSTAPNALTTVSYAFGGDVISVGSKIAIAPIPLGTADFLVHHIHAFTIHVSDSHVMDQAVVVLVKYLLGTIWKMQSDVWGTVSPTGAVSHITGGNFAQSSITINGWLRDFLWSQAAQVVQSYGSPLSAYGLIFLGAHFIWAFSLMFLFSGRGYWQELIESIVWAHNKLKVAPSIQPRALSITQGRAVGLAHYLLGGIGTTWSFFLARIISVG